MPKKPAEKDKKPIQVYMSPEHLKELNLLKKALGVESDSEALRIAIRLAYEFPKTARDNPRLKETALLSSPKNLESFRNLLASSPSRVIRILLRPKY